MKTYGPHRPVSLHDQGETARSAVLEPLGVLLGERDPGQITRSAQIIVSADEAAQVRATVLELVDAGVTHIVMAAHPPPPDNVASWLADEIIAPVSAQSFPT